MPVCWELSFGMKPISLYFFRVKQFSSKICEKLDLFVNPSIKAFSCIGNLAKENCSLLKGNHVKELSFHLIRYILESHLIDISDEIRQPYST